MRQFALLALLVLYLIQCGVAAETNLRRNHAASHQRRELSMSRWWSTVMASLHCFGPHHHECMKNHHTHHGGGSSSCCTDDSDGDCTDDCSDDDSDNDDARVSGGDDTAENACDDDGGCTDDWSDDRHHDDTTDVTAGDDAAAMWAGDDHTVTIEDYGEGDDDAWQKSGWQWSNIAASATIGNFITNDKSGQAKTWGMCAVLACLVGATAFVLTRKRKQDDRRDTNDFPQDVYIQQDGNPDDLTIAAGSNVDVDASNGIQGDVEMATVKTNRSRAASIKSAISQRAISIKSRLVSGRKKSTSSKVVGGVGDSNYMAPSFAAIPEEGEIGLDLATTEDGGVVM